MFRFIILSQLILLKFHILSPIILSFYLIYFHKKDRNLNILLFIIFCLLFFWKIILIFLDLYLISTIILLFHLKQNRFRKYLNFFIISIIPFSLLTISVVFYSIVTLSYPALIENKFEKSMNNKAHNFEMISWINSKIKMNEKVLYDETIRSKNYQSINLFIIIFHPNLKLRFKI